ncbi:hypothetical protein AB2B41_21795, partial [Marimonas sp. MJW-29]
LLNRMNQKTHLMGIPFDSTKDGTALAQIRATEADLTSRILQTSQVIHGTSEVLAPDWDSEPRRVCRRLIDLSYAAMSDLSRAAQLSGHLMKRPG